MNYHTPATQNVNCPVPQLAEKSGEIVCPEKVYLKKQFPSLPYDMVKIKGRDGTNIYIRLTKIKDLSLMDV